MDLSWWSRKFNRALSTIFYIFALTFNLSNGGLFFVYANGGYNAYLADPTPPDPSDTFTWVVEGSSPGEGEEISHVELYGCWGEEDIDDVDVSSGDWEDGYKVEPLSDGDLPLEITITFNTEYESAEDAAEIFVKTGGGPEAGFLFSVGGPTCEEPEPPMGEVSAFKFNDLGGDGGYQPWSGDYLMGGWEICLIDESGEEDCKWTDGGVVSWDVSPGLYRLEESVQPDWSQTYPAGGGGGYYDVEVFPDGSVSYWYWYWDGQTFSPYYVDEAWFGNWSPRREPPTGDIWAFKFFDVNRDGSSEGDEPLPGWQICLWDVDVWGEPWCQETDDEGWAGWVGLESGEYRLEERMSETQVDEGWEQTWPEDEEGYWVWIDGDGTTYYWDGAWGMDSEAAEFGNWRFVPPPPTGTIMGHKFYDLNASGSWEPGGGEPSLGGWKFYLDLNNDGAWEEGEPFDITNDGSYHFFNLSDGEYWVREVLKEGWVQTRPQGDGSYRIIIRGGTSYGVDPEGELFPVGWLDFGNHPLGTIMGHKFYDLNASGSWEPGEGEPSLGGWKFYLDLNNNGAWEEGEPFDVTNDGSYHFFNLSDGEYWVREVLKEGWVQTRPQGDGSYRIIIRGGTSYGVDPEGELFPVGWLDFGNHPLGTLGGHKVWDQDGDGNITEGEPNLGRWTINLYLDDGNGIFDEVEPYDTTRTHPHDGSYGFSELPDGSYWIKEVMQDGWTQTYPDTPGGLWYITVVGGQTPGIGWLDFGNRVLVPDLEVTKDASAETTEVNTVVTYTVVVSNTGETTLDITVTDDPPEGFLYLTGSATVDGSPSEPILSGGLLTWELEGVAPGQDVTIVYEMAVGELVVLGENVNLVTASSGELREQDPARVVIEEEEKEDGDVLGEEDVLPQTGPSNWGTLAALSLLFLGSFLKVYEGVLKRRLNLKVRKPTKKRRL